MAMIHASGPLIDAALECNVKFYFSGFNGEYVTRHLGIPARSTQYAIRHLGIPARSTQYAIRNTQYAIRNTQYAIRVIFVVAEIMTNA